MEYSKDVHKQLNFLRRQLVKFIDDYKEFAPKEVFADIIVAGKYSFNAGKRTSLEERMKARDNFDKNCIYSCWDDTVVHYIAEMSEAIQRIRRVRQEVKKFNPVQKVKRASSRGSSEWLGKAFPRTNTETFIRDNPSTPTLEVEHKEDKWRRRGVICIPVHWSQSVYEKGLALVNAPKGTLFIVRAQKRDVQHVNEEGMTAWKVTAIGSNKGCCYLVDGWVVTHNSNEINSGSPLVDDQRETLVPHAFGVNLPKAVSLMKSRTVRHLTKMLDV